MTKTELIQRIESYATAKATGDVALLQFAAARLKELLDALPEELTPPTPAP